MCGLWMHKHPNTSIQIIIGTHHNYWKSPKCLSTGHQMNCHLHDCTVEYDLVIKINELLTYAATGIPERSQSSRCGALHLMLSKRDDDVDSELNTPVRGGDAVSAGRMFREPFLKSFAMCRQSMLLITSSREDNIDLSFWACSISRGFLWRGDHLPLLPQSANTVRLGSG